MNYSNEDISHKVQRKKYFMRVPEDDANINTGDRMSQQLEHLKKIRNIHYLRWY